MCLFTPSTELCHKVDTQRMNGQHRKNITQNQYDYPTSSYKTCPYSGIFFNSSDSQSINGNYVAYILKFYFVRNASNPLAFHYLHFYCINLNILPIKHMFYLKIHALKATYDPKETFKNQTNSIIHLKRKTNIQNSQKISEKRLKKRIWPYPILKHIVKLQ